MLSFLHSSQCMSFLFITQTAPYPKRSIGQEGYHPRIYRNPSANDWLRYALGYGLSASRRIVSDLHRVTQHRPLTCTLFFHAAGLGS
jgi:hypothetical protein